MGCSGLCKRLPQQEEMSGFSKDRSFTRDASPAWLPLNRLDHQDIAYAGQHGAGSWGSERNGCSGANGRTMA